MPIFTALTVTFALIANGVGVFAAANAVFGISAFLIKTLAQVATSALVQLILGKPKQPAFGVTGTLQTGEDVPRQFPMGIGFTAGSLVYANEWGLGGATPNEYFAQVVALSDLPVKGLLSVMVDGVYVTLDAVAHASLGFPVLEYRISGRDYLWVKFYDGTQIAADAFMVSNVSSVDRPYTSTRVGTGCAYAICHAASNQTLFSGFPRFGFLLDSIKLYDISKDGTAGGVGTQRWATPSTWGGDGDYLPIVQAYNVMRSISYAGSWVYGVQGMGAGRLPQATWVAEINKCRATITGLSGPEPLYRSGGVLSVDAECGTAVEQILAACSGRMGEVGGIYKPLVGNVGASVVSFTDDNIISTEDQRLIPFQGLAETINSISAQYPEPNEGFAMKPAPQLYRSDLEILDGDRRLTAAVQLTNVPYGVQVQRLMKAAMAEARRARRHTFTFGPKFWGLEPNDIVTYDSVRHGYATKKFRVDAILDRPDSHVTVDLTEINPADYDFTQATDYVAQTSRASKRTTVAAQTVPGFAVAAVLVDNGVAGGQRPVLELTWVSAEIVDAKAVRWQGRLNGFTALAFTGNQADPQENGATVSGGLLKSTTYQVRARPVIFDRRTSWTAWINVTTGAANQVDTHTHVASDVTDFSEAVDDRVAALAVAGANITITYNDAGNTLTFAGVAGYTDEQAQDAVGAMIDASLTYVDATPLLQRAALTGAVTAAAGSNATALGSFTIAALNAAVSDADLATASFTTIAVSGQADVVADAVSDTLTLVAGSNVTLTTNAGTDTITIAAASGSSLGGAATITLTTDAYEWTETVTATGVTAAHKIVISAGAYVDTDEGIAVMAGDKLTDGGCGKDQQF